MAFQDLTNTGPWDRLLLSKFLQVDRVSCKKGMDTCQRDPTIVFGAALLPQKLPETSLANPHAGQSGLLSAAISVGPQLRNSFS